MQIGMIGLGRMGMNMARRLMKGHHEVVACNRTASKVQEIVKEGALGAFSLEEFVNKLSSPRVVWLMLPTGAVVDEHVTELSRLLSKGDLVVDGGNTFYKDDGRHEAELRAKGISFADAGVSGGVWGLQEGYCTMVGASPEDFKRLEPFLKTLCPPEGSLHCGAVGSGHFVKMVHNGIEYGMMESYAEGFEILKASPYPLNLQKISHLWNRGSVVRSWLLELAEEAFSKDPDLDSIVGYVEDSGEGRWTIQQAVDAGVPAPVLALSLFRRFASRQENAFSSRVLAALRNEFGGHAVVKKGETIQGSSAGSGTVRPAKPAQDAKPRQ
jgi:6-phosphogluconate dehydrogenase